MADVQPAPGTTGPVGGTTAELGLHAAWYNLMSTISVYGPKLVNRGAGHLDAVDTITKMKSNRLP